jgi:hypothetical protein
MGYTKIEMGKKYSSQWEIKMEIRSISNDKKRIRKYSILVPLTSLIYP